MSFTYSSAEAAEQLGAPSERWLIEQLRAGRFRGRKVGRSWRMTEQDLLDALDACSNNVVHKTGSDARRGLTPRSQLRITRR